MQYGIPYPGTYLVDRAGRVTAKYFEDDYTQRYTSADILVNRFGESAGAAHTMVEGKHLTVAASASNARARAFGTANLAGVGYATWPHLHVYAPGVSSDFVPIEWSIKESPALTVRAATFPPAKLVRLEAIKETAPVFEGAFRLVRDVTIARDAVVKPLLDADGNLTIEGALKYQACDEKLCYPPETFRCIGSCRWRRTTANALPRSCSASRSSRGDERQDRSGQIEMREGVDNGALQATGGRAKNPHASPISCSRFFGSFRFLQQRPALQPV